MSPRSTAIPCGRQPPRSLAERCGMPDLIAQFIDIALHLDVHLDALVGDYGTWVYAILFLIVFCETVSSCCRSFPATRCCLLPGR